MPSCDLLFQPWRCLCRGFSQITRTLPWRRMTLHFSQIFLTLGRTFMGACFRAARWTTDDLEKRNYWELLVAIRDATSGEVVGGELYLHFVARQDADVVHSHLPGDVRQDLVAIFELHPEHCVRE